MSQKPKLSRLLYLPASLGSASSRTLPIIAVKSKSSWPNMSNNPVRKNVKAGKVRTFVWNFKKNTELFETFLRLEKQCFVCLTYLPKLKKNFDQNLDHVNSLIFPSIHSLY